MSDSENRLGVRFVGHLCLDRYGTLRRFIFKPDGVRPRSEAVIWFEELPIVEVHIFCEIRCRKLSTDRRYELLSDEVLNVVDCVVIMLQMSTHSKLICTSDIPFMCCQTTRAKAPCLVSTAESSVKILDNSLNFSLSWRDSSSSKAFKSVGGIAVVGLSVETEERGARDLPLLNSVSWLELTTRG